MERRLGASEKNILTTQSNLANTYRSLGRLEEALSLRRDLYSATLKLLGEEHLDTLASANNYASSLVELGHFEEAKPLLRKTIPVARRVLGESNDTTLRLSLIYGEALYEDSAATLDDLREAVMTLEAAERTARRVLGGEYPLTMVIEGHLRVARAELDLKVSRAVLRALEEETSSGGAK